MKSFTEEQLREKAIAKIKRRKNYAKYAGISADLAGAGLEPDQIAHVLRLTHKTINSMNAYGSNKHSKTAEECIELLISEMQMAEGKEASWKPEMVIVIEGGIVQTVATTKKNLTYRVIDLDQEKLKDLDDTGIQDMKADLIEIDVEKFTKSVLKEI